MSSRDGQDLEQLRTTATSTTDGTVDWTALCQLVRDGRRVALPTPEGTVVCMSEATYATLTGHAPGRRVTSSGRLRHEPRLTPREVEILYAVSLGATGAHIARDMGLAVNTVAQHLHAVRQKFGVTSTAEAVERAERSGHLRGRP